MAVLSDAGDDTWTVLAAAGDAVPTSPDAADVVIPLHGSEVLVLSGEALSDDDREVLRAFAGQVAIAVQQRELRADAERAAGLAEANELRTALLAAVSHDLRTPLSSIKASVTQPAPARRRLHAVGARASCSRRSTRAPTGSTTSSATCST